MGRPTTLTFELIAATADKLKSQNEKTNAKTVHKELGVGSLTTVYRLFNEWEAAQLRQSRPIDDILDLSVTRAINNLIANKLQDATADANQRLADIQGNADMLISEVERLEIDLEAKTTEFTVLFEQHSALAGRLQQLEAENMRTVAELATERQAAESARISLAKSELRLEAVPRIETALDKIRLELLQARAQATDLHEIAAVATAKLESEITQHKNNEAHRAEAMHQRAELAELRVQFASIKTTSK